MLFSVAYRNKVRQELVDKAKSDQRIVSAALVGSAAGGREDRWSDIDLTLAYRESVSFSSLLDDWTQDVCTIYNAVFLLDVWRDTTLYRVFFLPGCLQLDVSFSPEKDFGPTGPGFQLLFGQQYEKPVYKSISPDELLGWVVHHLVRTVFCAERGRLWQAEFWLSEARDCLLKIACLNQGLNPDHARGFDDLPAHILTSFKNSFVANLCRVEILESVKVVTRGIKEVIEIKSPEVKRIISILTELENSFAVSQ
jgi:hypothetical protein